MEVYGIKPKRFTKEWWEYFWDYYKFHTIAAVFVIIALITTVNECAHRTNYDLQIDYISENQILPESANLLNALIEENIDDVTENGKKEVYVAQFDMGEHNDPQYTQAMFAKYSVEAMYTDSFVFLMSKKYADELSDAGIFEKSEIWTSAPSYNGYCVSLEACTKLEEIGIDTSDLYIGVIKIRERDRESEREKNRPKQENGIKFAKFLINER